MWSHGIADASDGSGTSSAFRTWPAAPATAATAPSMCANLDHQRRLGVALRTRASSISPAAWLRGSWAAGRSPAWPPRAPGTPINITISRKAAALPDGNTSSQRPNLVPGASIYAATRSIPTLWFNPAAFSTPANGTWGNLGRYIGSGPNNYEIRHRPAEALPPDRASESELPGIGLQPVEQSAMVEPLRQQITSILNTGATGTGAPRRVEFMLRAEF